MQFKDKIKSLVAISSGIFCLAGPALASSSEQALLVMPNCLEKAISIQHEVTAYSKELSLVKLADNQIEKLALQAHEKHCGGFINVSDSLLAKRNPGEFLSQHHQATIKDLSPKPYSIQNKVKVNALIKEVEPNNIWQTLSGLTSFDDRYSRGSNGRKAALWLEQRVKEQAVKANRSDFETFLVETGGSYVQPSVVTVLGKDLPGEAVVLGAHMDTLSYMKPGADDDGSGSSSLMEAARVILNAEKLKRPVYFIWYSAEEMGLVGSRQVVKHFMKQKIAVKSVLQFDMTGYRYHKSDKMWMIGDNVDSSLSQFVESLIKEYIGVDVGWTKCHYACSDHASWTQAGSRSPFPFEAKFGEEDPYIHSSRDTMDHVSLEHMTNFSKLAVAFTVEQASS